MKQRTKRLLSWVLTLVMVVGLVPWISLTARAETQVVQVDYYYNGGMTLNSISADFYDDNSVKSITATYSWGWGDVAGQSLVLVDKMIPKEDGKDYSVTYPYFDGDSGNRESSNEVDTFEKSKQRVSNVVPGIQFVANSAMQEANNGENSRVLQFSEGQLPSDGNNTYYLFLWTDRGSNDPGVYPDYHLATVIVSGGKLYTGKGESVPAVPTYTVTLTGGDNATPSGGNTTQSDLKGKMTDVVYTANEGYYFPTDYNVAAVNGISVTRNDFTKITVSGTPTDNATVTLTAPTAKTKPDAPTTAAAVNCTTSDDNDGTLTGVTTAMEYKKSDAADWTTGTGSDITGLVPGTYYVRVKATDTTNASGNQELTIADYLSVTKTAAKADLDTLQSGKNQNDYDAADWTTLTQAITDGKTAIDNATTTEAVTTAKNNAIDAVNAVKTKAQKALDNAKTSAVNTVNAVNANDYIAADQQTVTDAKTTALAAIEAATTEEEVTTALNNFNNAIASRTTQVVADQIAQVMSEVSAKTGSDMTYTGSPIQLINTPTTALPAGYTMKYAITTENVKPTDDNLYTTSIPSKTEAGTYYVWYKAVGDDSHTDSEPACVTVTVAEKKEEVEEIDHYDEVPLTVGEVKDITGTEEAPAETNPYGTKIVNSESLETLLKVTDTEKAVGVNVWLDVQDGTSTVPETDKAKILSTAGDYAVGQYLDVNLFKKVGNNDPVKVSEPNGKVKVSIVIPESLRKDGRTFRIIKVHNGVASAIDGTYDASTSIFTFETDSFSSYAIAYKDGEEEDDDDDDDDDEPAQVTPVVTTTEPRSPKTGDDMMGYSFWLMFAAAGLAVSGMAAKGRKEQE